MPAKSGKRATSRPRKKRGPMRDNSRNLAVRMTEEQYQQLQRFMALTHLPVTTYFRHLITGFRITANSIPLERKLYAESNKIYSNVRQIARNPRARELGGEQVKQMLFLERKLSEQLYLILSKQDAL